MNDDILDFLKGCLFGTPVAVFLFLFAQGM
jgi:hypothetical protein